jgi:hypothetical protein
MEENEDDLCREFGLVNPKSQKICKSENKIYQCVGKEWIENKTISKA